MLLQFIFGSVKNDVYKTFCSIKKWMVLEIVDKNVFEIMTLPNNLVFISRFKDHNLVYYSLYVICENVFAAKIWFRKLQPESWNTNLEWLNQTLGFSSTWWYRPSQIACTVTTMYLKCTRTELCVHENSCTVLIENTNGNYLLPAHTDYYALKK